MATLSNAAYQPGPVPSNPADIPRFLQDELAKIAATCAITLEGNYAISYAPPARTQPGMVRYCDGVRWNPDGQGEGLVVLKSDGVWHRIV